MTKLPSREMYIRGLTGDGWRKGRLVMQNEDTGDE